MKFSRFLAEHRDEIVARFVQELEGKHLSPAGLSEPLLVDHIPAFVDQVVAELAGGDSVQFRQDAFDVSHAARRHGAQRWHLGYDLEALVREYGVLRHAVLECVKTHGLAPTVDEFDVLSKCLNVAVAEATSEYTRFHDRQLQSQKDQLEFLTRAGQLLSSSLDYRSTLARLTELLVPGLADWCAIHFEGARVEDMPIAHVDPAMLSTVRELYLRSPPGSEAVHCYPDVVRTGEPQLVEVVDPKSFERAATDSRHLAMLRAIGACSWLIVPLQIQGRAFGALALVHSVSGRHYGRADLVLATELASRASTAIDNARLYELSQHERARVELATRAKDEFVAMVSHELKTPLNPILGWTRLLRSGALSPEKREYALQVIERNAITQERLVGDLLDVSRVITGKIRIVPSQVDVAHAVAMEIEGVRPGASAKRICIETDLGDGNTVIQADSERFRQVVWNLLSNAIKFTPKDGRVWIRLQRLESDVELSVTDTGEGITSEFLPYVFDRFLQADTTAARRHGGLGIGLSIAKHLVELHGGSIEARSEGVGRGSTFTVRLPLGPAVSRILTPVTRATTDGPLPDTAPPATGVESVRVLVVDDEPDARELVGAVLELSAMQVRTASNAADALAAVESFLPHVIISDVGMPDGDGYSLIRSVRTLPRPHSETPAIALTAFASTEDRRRALVAGFNVHVAKPVEPATLVKLVSDLARIAKN